MQVRLIAAGIASYVPGIHRIFPRKGTGGTDEAAYCYGIWLKHIAMASANGLREVPKSVAEIGPGDSLGVGIAALLSGAQQYRALDVVRYASSERSLRILDDLVTLFRTRAARPVKGWPDFDEHLDERLFPSAVLGEERLSDTLADDRVAAIRAALLRPGEAADGISIDYAVPWTDVAMMRDAEIDMALSHSVLEHVTDLPATYAALHRWLKPGGWTSHQIDFTCHGVADRWNGHWGYSEPMWRLIFGKRPFLINREPRSTHEAAIRSQGFDIVCDLRLRRSDGIDRASLAPRWRHLDDDDLNCAGTFIQARRSAAASVTAPR